MKKLYTLAIKPYDGGYLVRVPDVSGCVTSGKTLDEAFEMVKDALCGCLCVYEDEGIALPDPHEPQDTVLEEGEFAAMIEIDLLAYRAETDTRAVRKNVSMPAWLSNLADRRGLNCSQLLQDAIKRELQLV